MNETNISQWTVTAAYAAAILFAIHLVTYVIAPIRDATPSSSPTYLSLRYGGHIAAALWIASASWQTKGAMRIIGWFVALDLALYSFIAYVPFTFVVLLPSLVLLPLWLWLVGRLLAREREHQQGRAEFGKQQATQQE